MYRACCLVAAFVLGTFLAVAVSHLERRRVDVDRPIVIGPIQPNGKATPRVADNSAIEPEATAEVEIPVEPIDECDENTEPAVQVAVAVPGQQPTLAEADLAELAELKADEVVAILSADVVQPISGSMPEEPVAESAGPQARTALKPIPEPDLFWHQDYAQAWHEAKDDGRMLFVYFHDMQQTPTRRAFETKTLANPKIKAKLAEYVLLKLPRDAVVSTEGRRVGLLQHSAFYEMLGRQGIAVIDFAHVKTDYYGHVVSAFPFTTGKYYRGPALDTILTLPPGTITQRTMIYAVRIHPEAPASTQGNFHNVLADEAKLHSSHQAAILVQGHHNWENRFHRINARLPAGVMAQEVVAESWPNESLVDACVDCVDSWHHSPGHWNAVRSRHPVFGFDIKRGRNGIWYATGIFGRR